MKTKPKFKSKIPSAAQEAARVRNFSIFRLKGILATLGNIRHINADDHGICTELSIAADAIQSAIQQIKES